MFQIAGMIDDFFLCVSSNVLSVSFLNVAVRYLSVRPPFISSCGTLQTSLLAISLSAFRPTSLSVCTFFYALSSHPCPPPLSTLLHLALPFSDLVPSLSSSRHTPRRRPPSVSLHHSFLGTSSLKYFSTPNTSLSLHGLPCWLFPASTRFYSTPL